VCAGGGEFEGGAAAASSDGDIFLLGRGREGGREVKWEGGREVGREGGREGGKVGHYKNIKYRIGMKRKST